MRLEKSMLGGWRCWYKNTDGIEAHCTDFMMDKSTALQRACVSIVQYGLENQNFTTFENWVLVAGGIGAEQANSLFAGGGKIKPKNSIRFNLT
jgi:hypothetical protein